MAQSLHELGWKPRHAEAFRAHDDDGWPGRVSRIDRGGWLNVETADGSRRARKHPRFRRLADPLDAPTVGDWVVLRDDPGGGPPLAEHVLPRTSLLQRNAGDDERTQPQALAANIDTVLIVVALDVAYNPRRTDRFLSLALTGGAQPVLVLTKADLHDDVASALDQVRRHVREVEVVAISSRAGTGLGDLQRHLQPGQTVVLVGQSGAGKSTLANRLTGEHSLAEQEVRKDGKGRHTTSHRQLLRLPSGGLLIDTPGLRSVGMLEETVDEGAFSDIEELAARCRFSDCAHEAEPGCAVLAALESGDLDPQRWESYAKLAAEAQQVAQQRVLTERAQRGRRRR
ncbi:MAG TPA: ribosome small subunit-dependent GTPase A [Egibacteraceae bacterium]|nr:ribosome small subunit-dependent GTPase A [Egibacteraceae bacterium]